jgi:hypothetical protein
VVLQERILSLQTEGGSEMGFERCRDCFHRSHVPQPMVQVARPVSSDADVMGRVQVARPVSSLRAGQLLQVPWGVPEDYAFRGGLLVIQFGFVLDELLLALTTLGASFKALVIGQSGDSLAAASSVHPQAVRAPTVNLAALRNILEKSKQGGRPPSCILFGARLYGLPAMENAQLLLAWSVLAKELQEIAASSGIAFLELLVTQANLDQLGDQISEHFQQFPLLSDSGRFGYVSQRAAFWLRGPLGTTSQFRSDEFTLPEGAVILPPGAAPVLWARDLVSPVLDWRGKPVPESVVFGGGRPLRRGPRGDHGVGRGGLRLPLVLRLPGVADRHPAGPQRGPPVGAE